MRTHKGDQLYANEEFNLKSTQTHWLDTKMVVAVHSVHSYVLETLGEAGTWGLANVPDGVNKEGEKQILGLKNIQLGMQRASQPEIAISTHTHRWDGSFPS